MELRPAVRKFAEAMERKLQEHDHDRGEDGWLADDPASLLPRIEEELEELKDACSPWHFSQAERARDEAVDVANFAMMIYDVCD